MLIHILTYKKQICLKNHISDTMSPALTSSQIMTDVWYWGGWMWGIKKVESSKVAERTRVEDEAPRSRTKIMPGVNGMWKSQSQPFMAGKPVKNSCSKEAERQSAILVQIYDDSSFNIQDFSVWSLTKSNPILKLSASSEQCQHYCATEISLSRKGKHAVSKTQFRNNLFPHWWKPS